MLNIYELGLYLELPPCVYEYYSICKKERRLDKWVFLGKVARHHLGNASDLRVVAGGALALDQKQPKSEQEAYKRGNDFTPRLFCLAHIYTDVYTFSTSLQRR